MQITWVEIAVFIVLALSLAQPWLIKLGNKIFKKGKVEINEYGNLEISYGSFGPSIGLNGTLLAINNDFFVQSIDLSFRKIKDNSEHRFEWVSFRSPSFKLGKEESEQTLELATGFMLYAKRQHHYNIFFSDRQTQDEIRPIFNEISEKWMNIIRQAEVDQILSQQNRNIAQIQQRLNRAIDDAYQQFTRISEIIEAWESFKRNNYWDAGEYELTMNVNCSIPKKTFSKTWRFSLTNSDYENLKLNSLELIAIACFRPARYWYAFPKYESLT